MLPEPRFITFCVVFAVCLAFIIVGVIYLRKKDKGGPNKDKIAYTLIGLGVGVLIVMLVMIFLKNRIHVMIN